MHRLAYWQRRFWKRTVLNSVLLSAVLDAIYCWHCHALPAELTLNIEMGRCTVSVDSRADCCCACCHACMIRMDSGQQTVQLGSRQPTVNSVATTVDSKQYSWTVDSIAGL